MYQQSVYGGARHDAKIIADAWDVKVSQSSYGGLRYEVVLEGVEFSEIVIALKDGGYTVAEYDKVTESDGYWEADFNAIREHGWLEGKWVQCYGVCFSDENIWYLHFSNWDGDGKPRVRSGDAYMVRDLCVEECMLDLSDWDY